MWRSIFKTAYSFSGNPNFKHNKSVKNSTEFKFPSDWRTLVRARTNYHASPLTCQLKQREHELFIHHFPKAELHLKKVSRSLRFIFPRNEPPHFRSLRTLTFRSRIINQRKKKEKKRERNEEENSHVYTNWKWSVDVAGRSRSARVRGELQAGLVVAYRWMGSNMHEAATHACTPKENGPL